MDVGISERSAEAAKAESVVWLNEYQAMSRFDWEQESASTISCDPLPGLPCYVMAMAAASKKGYRPVLALTVGAKGGDLGYWQGFFPDKHDKPDADTTANLVQLERVVRLLVSACRIPA